jgi:hypothetical protein
LVTGLLRDCVWLTTVLVHASVDGVDDIRADGGLEDLREGVGIVGGSAIGADDGNGRPAHLYGVVAAVAGSSWSSWVGVVVS